MRFVTILMLVAWAAACFGAEPGSDSKGENPRYQGKPLSEWKVLAKSNDASFRRDAAFALGEFPSQTRNVLPLLNELLRDADADVRSAASLSVGGVTQKEMGPDAKLIVPALTALLKDNDESIQFNAARALGRMGADAKPAVPILVEMLKIPGGDIDGHAGRRFVVEALGEIGPAAKDAAPTLVQVLDKGDVCFELSTAMALGAIGPGAIPSVIELIKKENGKSQRFAVLALERMGQTQGGVPAITQLLDHNNVQVRKAAAVALGKTGLVARIALPKLTELRKDKNEDLRKAAAVAIERIEGGSLRKQE